MVAAAQQVAEDGREIRIVQGRNSGAQISSTGLNLVGS
jgi:beta-ribofuranosylaminobenzene 5'-phosphate synthase